MTGAKDAKWGEMAKAWHSLGKAPWGATDCELSPEGWVPSGCVEGLWGSRGMVLANMPRRKAFLSLIWIQNNKQSTVPKPRFFPISEKNVGFLVKSVVIFFAHFFSPAKECNYYLPHFYPVETWKGLKDPLKL